MIQPIVSIINKVCTNGINPFWMYKTTPNIMHMIEPISEM